MAGRGEVGRLLEAVVYAYEHDALSAAEVMASLGQDASEREIVLFTALLAIIERDAGLLGTDRVEHARNLSAWFA